MWRELDESVVDPITLEPIRDLAAAPFRLGPFYFDAEALAAYLVASGRFENPLDRSPLSRAQCAALDAHCAARGLRSLRVAREHGAAAARATRTAAEAARARATVEERRADAARAAAAGLLEALFAARPGRRRGGAPGPRRPLGPAMIDDDETPPEVLASAAYGAEDAAFWEDACAFPALPAAAAPGPAPPAAARVAPPAAAAAAADVRAADRSRAADWSRACAETRRRDAARRDARRSRAAAAAAAGEAAAIDAALLRLGLDPSDASSALAIPRGDAILAKARAVAALRDGAASAARVAAAAALWPAAVRAWAAAEPRAARNVERECRLLLGSETESSRCLLPMRRADRRRAHAVCEAYGFATRSYERSPERYVRFFRPPPGAPAPAAPEVSLADAAAIAPANAPPDRAKDDAAAGTARALRSIARARPARRPSPPPPPPPTDAELREAAEDAELREAIRRSLEDAAPALSAPPTAMAALLEPLGLGRLAAAFEREEVRDARTLAGLADDELGEPGVDAPWERAALRDAADAALP